MLALGAILPFAISPRKRVCELQRLPEQDRRERRLFDHLFVFFVTLNLFLAQGRLDRSSLFEEISSQYFDELYYVSNKHKHGQGIIRVYELR